MKIRKAFQGTMPENKILDTYSTSQTDTYSCNYVNVFNSYSTTEKVVGKWIDGKPLYQKTIDFGTLPNNALKTIAHNISNLKRAVNVFGCAYRSTDKISFPLPYATVLNTQAIALYADDTDIVIVTGQDRSNLTECYVTLEYTKTTD